MANRRPNIKKKNAGGENNGLRYAMAAMQGWRNTMEDSHRVSLTLPGELKEWAFAGVFDGHGGQKVSTYTSKNLTKRILRNISDKKAGACIHNVSGDDRQRRIKDSIDKAFLKLDDTMRKSRLIDDNSGTTAVCVLVTDTHYYFANCGDSRAILCRQEKVGFSTTDHKPTSKTERKRIVDAGGWVNNNRVNGGLGVSRALGDFQYKNNANKGQCDQLVSPQPDITVIERNDQTDNFIVLACDGVFDVMSNSELLTFIKNQMTKTRNLRLICNKVVDHCLEKGSRDNMSIVIMTLPSCPSQEDMQRKRKLDLFQMNHVLHAKRARVSNNNLTQNENPSSAPSSSSNTDNCQQRAEPVQVVKNATTGAPPVIRRRRGSNVPSPFILYFLDYWKTNGGNVCQTAKECGESWSRLARPVKQLYRRRYRQTKRRRTLKNNKSS